MAVSLQHKGHKFQVVRSRAAIPSKAAAVPDRKGMIDNVRYKAGTALSSAMKAMRQAAGCDAGDPAHKAVMTHARDAIADCAIAMTDCSYYDGSSAAESVASSKSAAMSLRKAMSSCMTLKSACGDCSPVMLNAATSMSDAAKAAEANAGIEEDIDDEEVPAVGDPAFKNAKRFDMDFGIDTKAGGVTFDEIKDKTTGAVLDYQNVKIKGYLSTFKGMTPADHEGDYVEPGAFKKTLPDFRKNPVMLRDHVNMTSHLAGSFTSVDEDSNGLIVEGLLSNAPDCKDVRFKIVEGHLKTLSMGGVFHYGDDGQQIKAVRLFEGSLTPVPANQDARFRIRALNDVEQKFLKTGNQFPSFYHFLIDQNRLQNARGVAA